MEELHRIFVGGLFESITKDELSGRFQSFGNVTDTTIIQKKDGEGNVSKTFGYVNLMTTTQKLNKCFALFGGTKWKGHQLKVQLAKENFMARLEREWKEPPVEKKKKKHCAPPKTYDEILETTSAMKKSVPGTPVEGERNWVIGKYRRPLPIVYIPSVGRRKVVKIDPSKFCHCLKRIPDVDDDGLTVDTLTWSYDNEEKDFKIKKKKRKKTVHLEYNENTSESAIETNEEVVKSVGCVEEITGINGDVVTPEKKKKKKRKVELKGNTPMFCSSEDINSEKIDSVNKKKRKDKDKKLEVIQQTDEGNDNFNMDLTVPSVGNKSCIGGSSEKYDKIIQNGETIDGVGYSEEITNKDGNSDTPPQKKKKKRRKSEVKDNIPNFCSPEDNNVTKDVCHDKLSESAAAKETSKCTLEEEEYKFINDCIPSVGLCEDIKEDPNNIIDSNKKTLGTSIIQQLLSKTKTIQSNCLNCNKSSIGIRDNSEHKDETGVDIETRDEDEIENIENLFDFEFKDIIGGKNESFLKKLMENVEIREHFNENIKSDSNDESDSSSDSSYKHHSTKEVKNGHSLDVECAETIMPSKKKLKIKKNEKNIDSSVENNKQLDTNKKINKLNVTSKQEKHAISEEQRKKSLAVRNSQILQHKGVVSKALKDVDKSNIGSANRIVFDESEGEEESVTKDEENKVHTSNVEDTVKSGKPLWDDSDEEVVPPDDKSAAKNTLLFGDDDEENDEEDIKVKPQFQGKGGEKLFKMQQRFGGDERFRLDERFAEEDNVNNDKENNSEDAEDITDADADLKKEREMNISVLGQVLGKPVELGKKASDYIHQRYDPENVDHEKFEVKVKTPDINTKEEELEIPKVKKDKPVEKLPEVSKETFYSVDDSIKDLFGKEESSAFSFLGSYDQPDETVDEVNEETNSENKQEEIVQHDTQVGTENSMDVDSVAETRETIKSGTCVNSIKEPSWKRGLEKMSQCDQDLREQKIFNDTNEKEVVKTKKCTYLYIADDDERLETGKRFIRTENIEEITNQWKAIRRNLTEDYKKKHKDALRRIRKLKDRRFNRR